MANCSEISETHMCWNLICIIGFSFKIIITETNLGSKNNSEV